MEKRKPFNGILNIQKSGKFSKSLAKVDGPKILGSGFENLQ